jgi:hypothetical protein
MYSKPGSRKRTARSTRPTYDEAACIDRAIRGESARRRADRSNFSGGDEYILFGVGAAGRIDEAAVLDVYFHVSYRPECS